MASPTVKVLIAVACTSVLAGVICIICGISAPNLLCSQTCDEQCAGKPNYGLPATDENNLIVCQTCTYRIMNITAGGTCDAKYISNQETFLRNSMNPVGALLLATGLVMGICLLSTTRRVINVESSNVILLVLSLILFVCGGGVVAITRSSGANICDRICDDNGCGGQYPTFAQASFNSTNGRTHCLSCQLATNSTTQCTGLDISIRIIVMESVTYPFAAMFVLFACILLVISLVNSSKPRRKCNNEVQMAFDFAGGSQKK